MEANDFPDSTMTSGLRRHPPCDFQIGIGLLDPLAKQSFSVRIKRLHR